MRYVEIKRLNYLKKSVDFMCACNSAMKHKVAVKRFYSAYNKANYKACVLAYNAI